MNGKYSFIPNNLLIENRREISLKSACSKSIKTVLFVFAVLISTVSISQTGPAGVSANLRLWLDGSDPAGNGTPPGAGVITQWNDKSSNADHLDAPGGATDPDYIPSEATFNGKGVLDFDATDIFRKDVTDWTSNHTIFIVFKQQGAPVAGTCVFSSGDDGGGGNDDRFEIQVESTVTNFTYHTNAGATVTESVFGTQAAAVAGPVMYSATRSGNNITCYENGVQSSTMTTTNGGEFDEYVLNTNRLETIGNDCLIAEVIIYDVVLTAAEIGRINNYLACKYGLAIAGVTPGGIDPCNVGLWLKADAGITLTGTDVTNWKDQSNSNINGTATAAKEPTFLPVNNNFNPSMRFDTIVGGGDEISLGTAVAADGMILGSNNFSIYSVALADPATNGVLFSDRACVTPPGYNLKFNAATSRWRFLGGAAALADSATVKTNNANSGFSLLRVNRSSATNYSARTNFGTITTGTSLASINYTGTGPTERWIGKEATCASYNFQGNLSELIIVRNALTATEDKQIQSYLALKYGISLSSGISDYLSSSGTSIWSNPPYWNDVAGIGRDNGSLLNQRISKSQDKSGIVTIATTNNFTLPNNDVTRTSLTDGSFLIWGNNNNSAATPWTVTGAPADYAILSEVWKVRETGTVPAVHVQVDVNDVDNNIPTFQGLLYIVRGGNISGGTITPMAETSPGSGIWRVSGINFNDGDVFTFAVRNKLEVEFSSLTAASANEVTANNFPSILGTGTINVATSFTVQDNGGGSASPAGVDYTYTNETVSVPIGVYTSNAFTLALPTLVNDALVEGLEDIQFSINAPSVSVSIGDANASGAANSNHSYTITDDDSYNISIITAQNGVENSTPFVYKIFVVGGPNPSLVPIVGTYSWGGTATPGTDFTTPTSFTIPVGVDTITVTVATLNDGLLEGTETAIATIATSTPGVVVAGPAATANITDDEMAGIGISIGSPVNATEGSSLSFTVSIDGGVINNSGSAINGSIGYGTGTAVNSQDFAGPTSFVISPGTNSTLLSFAALTDNLVENTETVIAAISGITIGGVPNSSTSTSTANIIDEDTTNLTISIDSSPATVVEGAGNTITYEVSLDGGKINGTGADITGTVVLSGTALLTSDYTPNITSFDIPDGSGTGTFVVTLTNDGIVESTESLAATISSPTIGAINGANNSVSISILDDDSGSLFVSIGSPTNATEGPASAVTFQVFIASGGPSATPITGTINYTGSASPTTDFVPVTSYTIPANTNSTTITLNLIDDVVTEPSETIIANLIGSPSVGAYANVNATATITDDDASSLSIYIDTVMSGAEGGANVQLVVGLGLFAVNGTGGDIYGTVTYSGSANGSDYTGSGNYAIPNGASSDTITLTVIDDAAVEYTDSIIAVLTSSNVGTISQADTAIAYIYDNEFDLLCISLLSPVDGDEEGPINGSFVVAIDNGWTNELGVPLTGTLSFGGTATAGSDFTNNATFSIPTGSSFATHSLIVIDDPSLELTESLIATITSTLEGSICVDTDTLTITDNDLANAELRITATTEGTELPNAIDAEFTVSITGGLINETGTDITGTITLAGTAIEGVDYTGVFDFTIANNSGTDVLVMQITDDLIEEPTETIIATISTSTLIAIGSVNTATANILDDDTDQDNDGLSDLFDPDPNNIDSDCDGIFDGCDYDPYGDGSYLNGIDTDGDGINDNCDAYNDLTGTLDNGPDVNEDGLNDVVWDPTDDDGDLLPNHVDPNDNNADIDGDGIPDGADADVDGDGVLDHGCDDDGDGIHNEADADDDPSDGITDVGNLDDDLDGIDNKWDPSPSDPSGKAINYIVSPNGDNVNETLFIPGIQFFEDHELIIYNRWGTPIYTSTNYNNDWAGEIELGIVVGDASLIEGTYFYTLDLGNGERAVRGYIEIRR